MRADADQPPPAGMFAWLSRSLVARLILLILVFVAVPIAMYEQFRAADEARQAILLGAIREKGMLIGRAMASTLSRADTIPYFRMGEELARYAGGSVSARLLFRPTTAMEPLGFFYVAAAPPVETEDLAFERQRLIDAGILQRLAESCEGDLPLALRLDRPDGRAEILTSIAPVRTAGGCWALVSSNTLDELGDETLGLPYWKFPEVRIAGAIYLALAVIVLFVFFDLWHSLVRFGRIAHTIRKKKGGRFAERNLIPELDGVAREFDRMVDTLHESGASIRRAAEESAHAFKTPLGIIRQSIELLRRRLGNGDARTAQALSAVDASLDKLDALIAAARRLDEATADVLDPPREPVDVSALARGVAAEYAQALSGNSPRLIADIADDLHVTGSAELIETAVENVLDNAISFTPPGRTVRLGACRHGRVIALTVEDEGPGVPPDRLDRIFDRYYSERPRTANGTTGSSNFGIGLWIVRRNVEAIGGHVFAANRHEGGLRLTFVLPAA